MNLEERFKKIISKNTEENKKYKPSIFDFNNPEHDKEIEKLIENGEILNIIDSYDEQLKELEQVKNPQSIFTSISQDANKHIQMKLNKNEGIWVFYPWKKSLVHILNEKDYELLRLSRNKGLILDDEQEKFKNFNIAIAGLNVGNPGAITIALEGGSKNVKYTDFDGLSVSNLNRFKAGLPELLLNKAVLSARQAYEIDPFLNIELYEKGLTPENINKFVLEPKTDLIIEEMDSLKLKIVIRQIAKTNKIPVLMVTGDGDRLIVDIERYDLDENIEILNGLIDKDTLEKILTTDPKTLSFKEKVFLARDFMGKEYLSDRLNKAFEDIGEKIAGIPQISTCSSLRGAALSYFSRQIAIGGNAPSGRYYVSISALIK